MKIFRINIASPSLGWNAWWSFPPPSRGSTSVKKYSRSKVGVREDLQLNFFFPPQFTSLLHNPINATHVRDSWSWLEECDLRIAFWAVYRKLWLITVWIHHRSRVNAFCRVPRNFNRHLLPQKKRKTTFINRRSTRATDIPFSQSSCSLSLTHHHLLHHQH